MTRSDRKIEPARYEVGYGKPPVHTRFRPGVSGNRSGRPGGGTAGRTKGLALQEAYRLVAVREGDKVVKLPAIQAVLRSQVALAAKGNGPAQRAVIAAVKQIEQELAAAAAAGDESAKCITVRFVEPSSPEHAQSATKSERLLSYEDWLKERRAGENAQPAQSAPASASGSAPTDEDWLK